MPRRSAARPQPAVVRQFLTLTTPIGPVEARPMFGGYGFYLEDVIFALEFDGQIWLKADKETRGRFEAAGCQPLVYQGHNRPVEMPYWTMPPEAARGGAALRRWIELSLGVARRAAERKRATVRRRPPREPDFI